MTRKNKIKLQQNTSPIFSFILSIIADIVFWLTLFSVIIFNTLVFNLRVKGRKNLKCISNKEGCFIISNHSLYLDPAIIAHSIAPRRTYFTALEETFQIPVIGTYIRLLGAFSISEELYMGKLIRNIKNILDSGRSIHFFPEGEMSHLNQNIKDFKAGVFYMACHFNKPVIPITIVIKRRTIFGFKLHRCFFRAEVIIGKPIFPSDFKFHCKNKMQKTKEIADYTRKKMILDIKSIMKKNA